MAELTNYEKTGWENLAAHMRAFYDACVAQGFTEEQAVRLTVARAHPLPDASQANAAAERMAEMMGRLAGGPEGEES